LHEILCPTNGTQYFMNSVGLSSLNKILTKHLSDRINNRSSLNKLQFNTCIPWRRGKNETHKNKQVG